MAFKTNVGPSLRKEYEQNDNNIFLNICQSTKMFLDYDRLIPVEKLALTLPVQVTTIRN